MTALVSSILWQALLGVCVISSLWIFKFVYNQVLRPLWHARKLPRPNYPAALLGGHLQALMQLVPIPWHRELGPVVRIAGPLGTTQISTDDRKALQHILVNEPYKFPKPWIMNKILATIAGDGILVAEGETHKRQRKIMAPSFGPAQMRNIYPMFLEKAQKLQNLVAEEIQRSEGSRTKLNFHEWTSKAALEAISSAGFDYETHAMTGDDNELVHSFNLIFGDKLKPELRFILVGLWPWMAKVINMKDEPGQMFTNGKAALKRVSAQLVKEKKEAILAESFGSSAGPKSSSIVGRDVLTALIRANMAPDLKPSQKLSDDEVLAQILVILLGGFDTTANTLAWIIFEICKNQEIQSKLREEILSLGTEGPTFDELNSMSYLDAVIRETLRVHAPLPGMTRVASEDSFVPLSKPFVDRGGKRHERLFIAKNTSIYIPILHMNTSPEFWGPDALEFRPERWTDNRQNLPEGVMEFPSVAFPTFLAGPKSCIGFRFSILEMKTIIFALVHAVKFDLAVPAEEIGLETSLVIRPILKSAPEEGFQMPVYATLNRRL